MYTSGKELSTVLFNILINDLEEATECTLSSVQMTPDWGTSSYTGGQRCHPKDLDMLEGWASKNLTNFNRCKYEVPNLGKTNSMQ